MGMKNIKTGIEIAAKAQQGFNQKQEEAIREVGNRVIQKVDEQGKIIEVVIDDLNAQEKSRLYSLKSQSTIKELGENEKELLVSILYTLVMKYDQNTEQQMQYYQAVRKYLEVEAPDPDVNFGVISNIDSLSQTKAIYNVVCEFLFLNKGDHSYQNTFEELLSCFYVRPQDTQAAMNDIDLMYDKLGIQGIVTHYDFHTDIVENDVNSNINEDILDTEESNTGEENQGTLPLVEKSAERARALKNENLEKCTIDGVVDSTANTVYRRKSISVNGIINCEKKVVFEECIILYGNGTINVNQDSELIFRNCYFECSNDTSDNARKTFCSGDSPDKLEISGCYFHECIDFLKVRSVKKIEIRDNLFYRPCFIMDINGEGYFSNNEIIVALKSREEHYHHSSKSIFKLYGNNSNESIKIENNVVVGDGVYDKTAFIRVSDVFEVNYTQIQHCSFYNVYECIEVLTSHISDCLFNKCKEAVSSISEGKIERTVFFQCTTPLRNFDDSNITSSQFIACQDAISARDLHNVSFEKCEFKYLTGPYYSDWLESNERILSFVIFEESDRCRLFQCVFDGIDLGKAVIARCNRTNVKLKFPPIKVEQCIFKNIKAEQSKLFEKDVDYLGIFTAKRKGSFQAISISDDCIGLDKIGQSYEVPTDISIPTETSDGEKIGANVTDDEIQRLNTPDNFTKQ